MKPKKVSKSSGKAAKPNHVSKKRLLKTFGLLLGLILMVALGLFLIQQYNSKYPAEGIAGKAYSDLTSEQKQVYWGCYKEKGCGELLSKAQQTKNYASYRACSKDCHTQALSYSSAQNYCQDSDGMDYFTKGSVTSNFYPKGKEDYCLDINGKNYLFEGVCKNNKAVFGQKNCKEFGKYECEGGVCKANTCDSFSYWEEVSNAAPYPNCTGGPSKTIGITFFIAKKAGEETYVVNDAVVYFTTDELNKAFNPHGIKFKVIDIIYTEADSPSPNSFSNGPEFKEELKNYFENIYEGKYNSNNLNLLFIPNVYGITSSCSHPWNVGAKYGKSRCYSTSYSLTSTPMVHEVGHWLGLLHTQHPNYVLTEEKLIEEYEQSGPSWVNPIKECHKIGDYVCDTPFDCYDYCSEVLGCEGLVWTGNSYENKCGLEYSPLTDNVMMYYFGYKKGTFTPEQGARARYYLNYRLTHELNENKLQELEE